MTIAYWCVLIAGVLPVVATGIAKAGLKGFDNNNPRAWLGKQTGYRARANAAQANSFEAFPFFAAAVIIAHLAHAPQWRIDAIAAGFIVLRLLYLACYLADRATLRTLVWGLAYACIIGLFVVSA
ncbi:MAG: putative rane protein [Betaproteobacteria bacterium]|nr:putative rane protein [Betaproteobacteria bacterium]